MLFKDNLSSSLWPWHLSWLEVTTVIFAVVIGATELGIWVSFDSLSCIKKHFRGGGLLRAVSCRQFHEEDVHCFKNKSKIWICRSETRVVQQAFSGWTTKKEQKDTLEHNFCFVLFSTWKLHHFFPVNKTVSFRFHFHPQVFPFWSKFVLISW